MARRARLESFSSTERRQLINLMLQYLTDTVVAEHAGIVHSGTRFFTGHRDYIAGMENFLVLKNANSFVPLPKWDPGTPIPIEFNVVKPEDNGAPRPPLGNLNPNWPILPEFAFPAVCRYTTLEELARAVIPWHNMVHSLIGGTMASPIFAPAAPIFWCWHAFIDDIYHDWQQCKNPSN